MPANSADNVFHIEETIKSSLNFKGTIDSQIASSSKKILLSHIGFQPAGQPYSIQQENLRAKYVPLNSLKKTGSDHELHFEANMNTNGNSVTESSSGESLPSPKIVLYPEDKIKLQWRKVHKIGSGLINMGNTCFLNSTLQCLTYTAPLVNYCLSGEHSQSCKQPGFCMMCELQRHIRRCYENSGSNIKPQAILQKLKLIAKHMHWGRQEDAHEFLRYVVDSMQRSTLNGHTKLDKFSKETTVVNQIFGGYLRSQVQCLRCKEKSNTYDPFMDISLDIKTVPSLEKAFEKYVQPEKLDCDNAYMCNRCKQKVPALKRFSIHKAPNVLTISLKRFDYSKMVQGKIGRHVHFPEKLNLRPYMSAKQGDPILLNLNAVLVHSGYTANSGHYYCYVKSSSGIWYCMNDANVQQVSASRVLGAEAYVLFYTKARSECSTSKPTHTITMANHVDNKNKFKPLNGLTKYPSTDTGVPIARSTSLPSVIGPFLHKTEPRYLSTATLLPEKRDKIMFGLNKTPTQSPEDSDGKRIVVKIKHGKATAYEKSPKGKSKIVNGDTVSSRLVPYGDDSESDDDEAVVNAGKKSPHVNGKNYIQQDMRESEKQRNDHRVVFDEKLNATTSVPGNTHLLETTLKQKGDTHEASNRRIDGLNLMVNKAKEQKASKTYSDDNGIQCMSDSSGRKVKATSSWHVLSQDCDPSYSVGSSSSRESVNSTSGWDIKEKSEAPNFDKVPDRQHPGWKISKENEPKQEVADNSLSAQVKKLFAAKKEDSHSNYESAVNQWRENSNSFFQSKSVAMSENQPLLADIDMEERVSNKKRKKHKKHKKEHKDVKYEQLVNESTSSPEAHSKKHKKKKHKHKKEHKHSKHSDDSEEERRSRKHKRSYDDSDEDSGKEKKKRLDEDSYVWVEKTKDTIRQTKSDSSVLVQSWDHHIKDGFKKSKSTFGDSKSYSTWDGSRSSKIAEELEKQSSAVGYGSSVNSWEGGKSTLDTEVESEKKDRKRLWSDDYDEELDHGKTKKIKKNHSDYNVHSGYNPFQKYQDHRNYDNNRFKGGLNGSHSFGGHNANTHHRDYRHEDHRNFQHYSHSSKHAYKA
ncbi:ubiquitin carboxyl-terminal hydrolase 36-like isoform X1 [Saccostrea echinata]|uniref:ubiquitin carboxyl-terminal hydrolase 36-like isoform X1 n=1 Tax=Saccostrea echinata TaxID=191078 RepID=UPI002A7EABFE|nr:ubiquitin carboxyl-terminal hydrolase 36-like isoform X1 [Saccostrea echinata]